MTALLHAMFQYGVELVLLVVVMLCGIQLGKFLRKFFGKSKDAKNNEVD